MEVITLLTLFSLLSLVRCAPLSTLLTCSIVHRGPLFLVWNGAHSPPQAPRQLVDIDHKGRLYISSERLCESTVRFVYEKCQNEGGETGVGFSPNYAGFPAAASFGNSMVSLYTGRLKLAGQRDRCVSSQAREHGSGADVRLSKCLEAESPRQLFQLLHVPTTYARQDVLLLNFPGTWGNVSSNSTRVLEVAPQRHLHLAHHKAVPAQGAGYSLVFAGPVSP